jgi:hypothetical protein
MTPTMTSNYAGYSGYNVAYSDFSLKEAVGKLKNRFIPSKANSTPTAQGKTNANGSAQANDQGKEATGGKTKLQNIFQTVTDWSKGISNATEVVNNQYINNEEKLQKEAEEKQVREVKNQKAGNWLVWGSIVLVIGLVVAYFFITRNKQ